LIRPESYDRSFDGVYDSRANRKAIFNRGMVPNIRNPRARKTPSVDANHFRSCAFQETVFHHRASLRAEDKFRRLLLRFERISERLEKPGVHDD